MNHERESQAERAKLVEDKLSEQAFKLVRNVLTLNQLELSIDFNKSTFKLSPKSNQPKLNRQQFAHISISLTNGKVFSQRNK